MDASPDIVLVETLTFEELDGGKTRLTHVSRFPSIGALEGMVGRGMERAAAESQDWFAELLDKQGR